MIHTLWKSLIEVWVLFLGIVWLVLHMLLVVSELIGGGDDGHVLATVPGWLGILGR